MPDKMSPQESMLGIFTQDKITPANFPDALKTIFASYQDISDMLICKVLSETEKESDLQAFLNNISSINEQNKLGKVGDSEERLLIESFRTLLGSYDAMKEQKKKLSEIKDRESTEKSAFEGNDLDIIY